MRVKYLREFVPIAFVYEFPEGKGQDSPFVINLYRKFLVPP